MDCCKSWTVFVQLVFHFSLTGPLASSHIIAVRDARIVDDVHHSLLGMEEAVLRLLAATVHTI